MPRPPWTPLTWLRRYARRLPFISWRDQKINKLRAENTRLTAQLALLGPVEAPSFRRYVHAARRIHTHMADRNSRDRGNLVTRKLKAYSFAQSHGIRVPTIFGLWDIPEDIVWHALPDHVVIKSNTGSTSRGVFPLRRTGSQWTTITKTDAIESENVVEKLRTLQAQDRIGGPFFAEELLGGGSGNALPLEVRVSAFYGEVSHALLRRATNHGVARLAKSRRILIDGTDAAGDDEVFDPDLPVPDSLDELFDVARRLSLCIPRPYVRVDLYDVDGEVVFGELTPRPGNPDELGPELDERLGRLWERAEARVLNDVIDGGDYRLRFGSGPSELRIGDDGVFTPDRGW